MGGARPGNVDAERTENRSPNQSALPFIGRQDDLTWLQARRAEARTLCGARIVGEIGVGKTRILREFLQKAGEAGDVVVQTGPDPAWAEIGYYSLRRAIVQLAALPETGGTPRDWVAATAEARHGLADVFEHEGAPGSTRLSPEERRFAAAEALRWSVVRASERARGHRVVLAVDDLHCVDGASRNAWADALSDPPLVPALLIGAYPPGFDPAWSPEAAPARVLTGLPSQCASSACLRKRGASSRPLLFGATMPTTRS
jgi:serine/threonine-protein kinase